MEQSPDQVKPTNDSAAEAQGNAPKENQGVVIASAAEIEELKNKLAVAEKKVEEYLGGWKRAKADYINFKRESEKQAGELASYACGATVMQIVPAYDDVKRAVGHIPTDQQSSDWAKGLLQAISGFDRQMGKLGIEAIKAVGEPFDPARHEAVGTVEDSGKPANTVVEEVSGGYTMHGAVLKPAKVKVAK